MAKYRGLNRQAAAATRAERTLRAIAAGRAWFIGGVPAGQTCACAGCSNGAPCIVPASWRTKGELNNG